MTEPVVLSERASEAIERFAKLAERSQVERRGDRRIDLAKRYTAARQALAARELAILDMTVLKRRTLVELAAKTGQTAEALALLLLQAGEHWADHFEAEDVKRRLGA